MSVRGDKSVDLKERVGYTGLRIGATDHLAIVTMFKLGVIK